MIADEMRISCYVERLTAGGSCQYQLREKESNRLVIGVGPAFDRHHFSEFLLQLDLYWSFVPTIHDRDGLDIVSVFGTLEKETEDALYMQLNSTHGGYSFR